MLDFSKSFDLPGILLFALLTISSSALPAQAKYGGGTGWPNDPYLIFDANQMNAIGADSNDWDKHFLLCADIDLSGFTGTAFNIIGYYVRYGFPDNNPFTGVFDGNDHTISNFTYDSNGTDNIGIFGYVHGCEIKNLGLINPYVDAGTGSDVGSLVGNLIGKTVTNCYAHGGSVSGQGYVGGLVGLKESTITNCYYTGSVEGVFYVGGLVGYNRDTITNCYASGRVWGDWSVGGLVGVSWPGTITNCYSTGIVSGEYWGVGGLVGWNWGIVTNCYSTGSVSGMTSVGGLAGRNYGAVIGSFWDTQTSGQTTSAGGTGKTTAEMQIASIFTDIGWGCGSVWTIDEGVDYPRLAWENAPGELISKTSYGGGSGEPNDPYLIYTAEQLNTIGLIVCDWDKHFKLMADIDLSGFTGTSFNVIGTWWRGLPFTGVFDGNDHTISNFTYTSPGIKYIGLFGYIDDPNAEIKNLGLIDPNVDAGTMYYVGSLVGWLRDGTISNCYVQGGSVAGDRFVGGLVASNDGTITNCHAIVEVSGKYYIGGLVGENNSGTISNCYSTGSFSGNSYIGVLASGNGSTGTITDCYSTGSVSGRNSGCLVGFNDGIITNCYSTGSVRGRGGGLAGWNTGTITNSCATGSFSGDERVGGLVGHNYYGTITNCYSIGSVSGEYRVGGLVGKNEKGTIDNCYASGTVDCDIYVGGLVGENYRSTITNCYSEGVVSGKYQVGGLAGRNNYGIISNCYSTGTVSGDGYVGGLVGYSNEGTISNSFWDIETSEQTTSAGGSGKTTAEMKTMSTFTDVVWDFTTPVWTIDEGVDYPRLWWELAPVLHAEPEVTLGTSNTISWDPVVGAIEYYAECTADANFTSIVYNTGWITETSCEFTGLEVGKRYWYSVKARNIADIETDWSNVESSLQGTLADAVDMMLDPNTLKNKNLKTALLNKVNEALEMLDEGLYAYALNKLQNDILQKTDGCAETGQPDKNDWIITCEGQNQIYPLVIETIEYVKSLME